VSLPRWSRREIAGFAAIGLAELLIFFNNPGHFFMGDTLLWMGYRYHSVGEFFRDFVTADPTLWYRPLTQRTVESVLYPLVGFHVFPYRLLMFVLFLVCTFAVFLVAEYMTESRRTAWLATLFFVPNVTHAFTTYDVAFVPEMVFTLFLVASVIAWILWLRHHNPKARIASAVFFIGSLLSKETAVALPFVLVAVWLFFPSQGRPRLRSLGPHFAILVIYLIVAIGFLHIRDVHIRQLIDRPGVAGQSGYQLVLGKNVQESAAVALSWAFGLPRGLHGQWPLRHRWMLQTLRAIRILICLGAVVLLWKPQRRFLWIGLAWFFIVASPTLPLLDHFLPHYLFAPLVGFSLAAGAVLDNVFDYCSRLSRPLAVAMCLLVLVPFAGVNAIAANDVAKVHPLLGRSADTAWNGMTDLKALYPSLKPGTTLLIFDEEDTSYYWETAHGMLFQMSYGDTSIRTLFSSDGIPVTIEDVHSGKVITLKVSGGHLTDFTSYVKQRPELLQRYIAGEHYHLDLLKPGVIKILELKDTAVNMMWATNGIVAAPFTLQLDSDGQASLPAANPGTYAFVAIQRVGEPNWVTVHGSIKIPMPPIRLFQ
jgi:hypothetical protein